MMRELTDSEILLEAVSGARLIEPPEDNRSLTEQFLSAIFFGFVK